MLARARRFTYSLCLALCQDLVRNYMSQLLRVFMDPNSIIETPVLLTNAFLVLLPMTLACCRQHLPDRNMPSAVALAAHRDEEYRLGTGVTRVPKHVPT
jgi:hypothetical protein